MPHFFSIEFWVVGHIVMDLFLILVVVFFWKRISADSANPDDAVLKISNVLEPLLNDAREVAQAFDAQLEEKRALVRKLNKDLDARVISLNLLLNRAENCLAGGDLPATNKESVHVSDLQKKVIALATSGMSADKIARRLKISMQEVKLVVDLKRKNKLF